MKAHHSLSVKDIYKEYETKDSGLSSKEANDRLLKNGKNALDEGKPVTWIQRFFSQMKDLMI